MFHGCQNVMGVTWTQKTFLVKLNTLNIFFWWKHQRNVCPKSAHPCSQAPTHNTSYTTHHTHNTHKYTHAHARAHPRVSVCSAERAMLTSNGWHFFLCRGDVCQTFRKKHLTTRGGVNVRPQQTAILRHFPNSFLALRTGPILTAHTPGFLAPKRFIVIKKKKKKPGLNMPGDGNFDWTLTCGQLWGFETPSKSHTSLPESQQLFLPQ